MNFKIIRHSEAGLPHLHRKVCFLHIRLHFRPHLRGTSSELYETIELASYRLHSDLSKSVLMPVADFRVTPLPVRIPEVRHRRD